MKDFRDACTHLLSRRRQPDAWHWDAMQQQLLPVSLKHSNVLHVLGMHVSTEQLELLLQRSLLLLLSLTPPPVPPRAGSPLCLRGAHGVTPGITCLPHCSRRQAYARMAPLASQHMIDYLIMCVTLQAGCRYQVTMLPYQWRTHPSCWAPGAGRRYSSFPSGVQPTCNQSRFSNEG